MTEQPSLRFAELLRQLRAEARLTQEELAEAATLSPRSVSDLERGINRTARKDTALLLADALNLAEPTRTLFVAAARGRAPAAHVLTARQGQVTEALPARRYGTHENEPAAAVVHGFSAALTSFIGRDQPVTEVASLLDHYRLITVTGPGGVGKTRLAVEVARRVAARFKDGVWLAELAPVRDTSLVAAAVAAALGVRERPGAPTAQVLAQALGRQQLLLVLDNCEHVIAAAAELCAEVLPACDDVQVLATSREPLLVAGEARYRLGPLTLPDPGNPGDADGSEAVALFLDRARRADTGFALDGGTRPLMARLMARLDGIPLAIELAAARVEALGVAQLLDRLDDRFDLLTSGDRMAADRHRSLAATVEWSYQLLDEHERRVFRAVSVFPGPFTLEAAEAVAQAGAGPVVLRLVDCSLLAPPRTDPDGRSRYVMLETLRAYGVGLLARNGEQDTIAKALAEYALRVARQAAAGLQTGTGEVAATRWLDAEDATMRQVLAWAMHHDVAIALRLAAALAPWWFLRGRFAGQHPLLLAAADRAEPGSGGWCAAQFWLGNTALFSADLDRALGHFTAIRDAVEGLPPSRALADCLGGRAMALSSLGRIAEAADDGQRSLSAAREVGYPAGEALALTVLSHAALSAGEAGNAVRLARRAEQIPADIPGLLARRCSTILTDALTEAGDLAAAERVCAAGLTRSTDAGDLWAQARLLQQMAILNLKAGRTERATAQLQEGFQVALRTASGLGDVLNGLDCCGHLCAATQRHAQALTVWAAYAALTRQSGFTDAPYVRRRHEPLREARQVLGPARARAAEERGGAMSLTVAVEYALMLLAPASPAAPASTLSDRERELVILVAQGRTDAQIAAQMSISVRAVSSHLDDIRDKAGCHSRGDLTRLALSVGLI